MSTTNKDRAFVLRSYPYGEADRVVVFFTENFGIVRGIAKGSRKLKSRIGGALEQMTLVNLRFVEKPGRELVVVTGCESIRSLFGSATDLDAAAAAGVISELTLEFHPERDPNPSQFRLLELAQKSLLAKINPLLVMHYVELFTLKLAGVLPPADRFHPSAARELMSTLLRTNLIDDPLPKINEESLQRLGKFLRKQITSALGKTLKAYSFLDDLRLAETKKKRENQNK